ncbi:MAG: Pr6Pr family membrane protein [Bacteroidota bacterium]
MTATSRIFATITAVIGWFAVIAQLCLTIQNRTMPVAAAVLQFFSYFTILCNIIVALGFSSIARNGNGSWSRFFIKPGTQTAMTMYIIVVGAVYNLVLRDVWSPQGLQKLVDELLHSVIPSLTLIFWLVFTPKKELQWKDAFPWLIFPLCYIVYIAIRGAITGLYPYPFTDVTVLGYPRAIANGGILLVVFLCLSLVLIGIGKWMSPGK